MLLSVGACHPRLYLPVMNSVDAYTYPGAARKRAICMVS